MRAQPVHQCECPECQQQKSSPLQELHRQMNFLVSTLDEHQQRLYAGLESKRLGHGGDRRVALLTGLNVKTVAKGRRELERCEPSDRIRLAGGGVSALKSATRRS